MNSLTHLNQYDCDIFSATMVTSLEQKHYSWKQRKLFYVEILLFLEKISIEIKPTWITWRIE